ncbi:hypothetical protein PATA110616_15355 [Paenibacillus tarimensis]
MTKSRSDIVNAANDMEVDSDVNRHRWFAGLSGFYLLLYCCRKNSIFIIEVYGI